MFEKADQQRDLRYAGYIAILLFLYLIAVYIGTQRLLSFWIGVIVAAPAFVIVYLALRISRLIGRLTGLNKPVGRVQQRLRDRIEAIVEELEDEIDEPR